MFDPWILSRALVSNNEKMLDPRPRDFISMIVLSGLGFYLWHPWPSYKMANLSSWDSILVTLGIPKPKALDFISAMIPMSSLPRTKASQTHSPS